MEEVMLRMHAWMVPVTSGEGMMKEEVVDSTVGQSKSAGLKTMIAQRTRFGSKQDVGAHVCNQKMLQSLI